MGGRTIGRIIRNDADLVNGLKALEQEKPGGRDVRFTDIDFNKLNFENQIRIDLKTDILVSLPSPLPLSLCLSLSLCPSLSLSVSVSVSLSVSLS
jgi:hypothetical protein